MFIFFNALNYLDRFITLEWILKQKLGKCLLSIFPEAVLGRVVILGMFQQKYSPNLPCLLLHKTHKTR